MAWSHTPSLATLLWISAAVPFSIWDSLYMFLRPHTLPGHKWNLPIWKPYITYAAVDRVYSSQAWEENNGFAGAQCFMNLVESGLYVWYLWLVSRNGRVQRPAEGGWKLLGWYGQTRTVGGRAGALAVVIGAISGAMTASKTVLYVLNEVFSGFHYLGHNDLGTLIQCWGVMVCIYFGFSVHMAYVSSRDIIAGLDIASGEQKKSPDSKQ